MVTAQNLPADQESARLWPCVSGKTDSGNADLPVKNEQLSIMNISMFQNNVSLLSRNQDDSNRLLEHIKEIILSNPGVINPNEKDFKGEVLAYVVYRELLKINKPIEFVLIIGAVMTHGMASIERGYSQDHLMSLKNAIAKNSICLLHQDEREHTATILNSDVLYDLLAKLLWSIDQQPDNGGWKTFYLTEMILILDLFHHSLHGQHMQFFNDTIRPGEDELAVLEVGYSCYSSTLLPKM